MDMYGKMGQLRHMAKRSYDTPRELRSSAFHHVIIADDARIRDNVKIAALYLPVNEWREVPYWRMVLAAAAAAAATATAFREISFAIKSKLEGGIFTENRNEFGVYLPVGKKY